MRHPDVVSVNNISGKKHDSFRFSTYLLSIFLSFRLFRIIFCSGLISKI